MKNSLLNISEKWKVLRDEFYEIAPDDNYIDEDKKYDDLFCQEDLLWITNDNYNLDLGWYGGNKDGHFGLYFFRGENWHQCELLEKAQTNDYQQIIHLINKIVVDFERELYSKLKTKICSIEDYTDEKQLSLIQSNNGEFSNRQ
jgi:hypothetical protein